VTTLRNDAEIERLVALAASGDEAAWQGLWKLVEPRLSALIRRRTFVAGMAGRDDETRDVMVAVMARLREDDFRRLRGYLASRREKRGLAFMPWLILVAKRVAIDCQRAHPDYVDRRRSAAPDEARGAWISPLPMPSETQLPAGRPPMTNRLMAKQILRYADGALEAPQRRALEMWAGEGSLDDIARELALGGPDEAERLVRSAVERLRRHFREGRPR
jgi:DNA-directed RNA polymerase specialized sigma24 family protein